jgi:hypothetical protein
MSERVIVVWRQNSNFPAISWREQVTFLLYTILEQRRLLDFYNTSSFKQQVADRVGHIILIPT